MKVSKKVSWNVGCIFLIVCFALVALQIVFLTMKCTNAIDWSWWAVLVPAILVFGLPFAVLVVVVITLIPIEMWKLWKTKKRVDEEAKKHGMKRLPGESTRDLKKRIVRRNMLVGSYTRKEVKDKILAAFPKIGSCKIHIWNYTITLFLRNTSDEWQTSGFTDAELREVAEFTQEYVPDGYTVTAKNEYISEAKEVETNGNKNTDGNA